MENKSKAFVMLLKEFKTCVEWQSDILIKTLRIDSCQNLYKLNIFNDFGGENEISVELTTPYTLEQNSVVKRKNQTMEEMTVIKYDTSKRSSYLFNQFVRKGN